MTPSCYNSTNASPSDLLGQTLLSLTQETDESLTFTLLDGTVYQMLHLNDCCEHVYIESIEGDLGDLVGSPILTAEEVSSDEPPAIHCSDESHTWTFYKFSTRKGYVDIRWYGSSNGYYSESVSFLRLNKKVA